jgi:hypothetical protein
VKRAGRDEPMWVVIHKCMESTLGMFLYSYLYLKLAKHYVFLISYIYSSTKLENKRLEQVLPGSGKGVGAVTRTMYTHASKCKNDKIKNIYL